jgi:hypothetical protein
MQTPRLSAFDQAIRAAAAAGATRFVTGRAANDARTVEFSLNGALLTFSEAMARWAADGDTRAWLRSAQPGESRRLDSLRTLHCYSAEDAQAMQEARAFHSRPGPAPVYPAPSCSEREEWARGVRQEGVL